LWGGDLVGGVFRPGIARLEPDGSVDMTFYAALSRLGPGGEDTHVIVSTIVLQPDGKVLIAGGQFDYVEAEPRKNFARLNSDGSLDRSFVPVWSCGFFTLLRACEGGCDITAGGRDSRRWIQ
jgi:hypothetical protein